MSGSNMFFYSCLLLGFLFSCSADKRMDNKQNKIIMVDSLATHQTLNLYSNLKTVSNNKVLLGHQDATAYGIGWRYEEDRSDIKSVTGSNPAVYGWEIGGIEREKGYSLDSVHFEKIRALIQQSYERGGVNTVSWHADNLLSGGDSWDLSQDSVVSAILPGGVKHTEFKRNLKLVGDFFLSLKDNNNNPIPVVFRPWHEHSGSWFWWGKEHCSPQEYKDLWKFTVSYLRDTMQVHNLIYTYSPDRFYSNDEYLERYPGDNLVDVLGVDIYHFNGMEGVDEYKNSVTKAFTILNQLSKEKQKPFVFSETGLETISVDGWFSNVLYPLLKEFKPAYILLWRNAYEKENHFYAPYPGHSSVDDFNNFKQQKYILFEDNMPDMYNIKQNKE